MSLLTWNDALSVKVASLDEQHQKLIAIINELHDAMMSRTAHEKLEKILVELVAYTKYHFYYEEDLMESIDYAAFEKHKALHKEFVDTINAKKNDYTSGGLFISIDLIQFLLDWLVNHIQGTDKAYSEYMIKRGIH